MSSITVVPDLNETIQNLLKGVGISFAAFLSLTSILLGVERSFKQRIAVSRRRRVFSLILFWGLLLAGVELLTIGHTYHIKSQKRKSEKNQILEKYGRYESPYQMKCTACDIGGLACFSVLLMWIYFSFLSKVSESVSRSVFKHNEQPISK